MTEVNITPFDNEISIRYKWARHFNIPLELIIVSTEIVGEKEEITYTNGFQYIIDSISNNNNLKTIYDDIADKIDTENITMIYAAVSKNKLEDKLAEINQLYVDIGEEQNIRDTNELRLLLIDWRENYTSDLLADKEDLDKLEKIHNELSRYPEILTSPIKIDRVTIKAAPTLKNSVPTPDDGIDMFDLGNPSYDVPYIRYNSPDTSLFKLYKGESDDTLPNYKIIVPTTQNNKKDTFYMKVWTGKGTLNKATKESYMNTVYNLDENILTIKKTPIDEANTQKKILDKISQTLQINIDNVIETSISGEFFLFDLDLNDIYLVDMILNTELMGSYLFVKETITSYADKKQLKVYYKSYSGFDEEEEAGEGYIVNPASVAASLTQNYSQGGEIVMVETPQGPTKFRLPPGLPYIRAKITQAESREVSNQFVKIFSRLMQFYKINKESTEKIFLQYIPELGKTLSEIKPITVTQPIRKRRSGDSKIDRLKDAAPDLFVNGYARNCQCAVQPIIVPPEEIEAWKNKTFLYKDVIKEREVMAFPPEDPKWYFVCPNDSAPYPGVKINKNLPNKGKYPYLPCCFKDSHTIKTAKSNYNIGFGAKDTVKQEKPAVHKGTYKTKTDKILSPGFYGFLPKSVSDLLSRYSDNKNDIIRTGVPRTVNSMLHSVSVAISDQNYLNLPNNELKEQYVSNIRNIITKQTLPNLLKQEMYDFTDEEIMEKLSNPEVFMDPNLFYRAVEEAYNINIYVFSPPKKGSNSSGSLEMPRFKLFHSRPPRNRISVLLFRTWGAESDALVYPQCELIVDRNNDTNKNITNFGKEMTDLLHKAITTLNMTITWELTGEIGKPQQMIARNNLYSRENFYELLKRLPTKQFVDGYGKNRGFIFPVGSDEITVIIPSTQPENLPIGEITRPKSNTVTSVFGKPIGITKTNDLTDGLWYQMLDLKYGIYIPIEPTINNNEIELGPVNPLVKEGKDVVKRLNKLQRDLEIIIQIMIWLFLISKTDVYSFIKSYVAIGKETSTDSSSIYDFSKLQRKLPLVKTVEEGIEQMKLVIPSLFKFMNRIYLYSNKFYEGLLYHLEKYDKERKPENPIIPTVIYLSDITVEDFEKDRHVAIFTNEEDMKTWLDSLDKLSFKNIIIEDHLDISNAMRTEPYLYKAPTGNIYLIQNVIEGDRLRAFNVAYNWYVYKINTGHKTDQFVNDIPVNVVYGISPALAPVIIENNAGNSLEYLQILSYGSGQYGAMLPLL